MRVPFIVLLLINTLFYTARPQNATSCVAGIYNVGSKASVTCLFHDATKEQKNGVVVTKHSMTASKESTDEDVGTCHFKKNTEPQCSARDGSYYFNITKHSMKIEIPQVSSQHEGRYACQVVPGDGITVYECLLVVKGASQPNNVNDVRDSSGSDKSESLHGHMKATLALVILIPLVVGVIVIILVYRKHWFPFKKKDQIQIADAEENLISNEEYDNGEQLSVGFRPDIPASVNNPFLTSRGVLPGPVVELENSLPLKKDVDAHESQGGREAVVKEEPAEEKTPETKQERYRREKQERQETDRKKKERAKDMKERLKKTTSKEEKVRIQEEYDEMVTRSHYETDKEAKKHMRDQYDEMTEALKNATSEEDKKRIQAKYDDQKEQWKTETEPKKKYE